MDICGGCFWHMYKDDVEFVGGYYPCDVCGADNSHVKFTPMDGDDKPMAGDPYGSDELFLPFQAAYDLRHRP